MFFHLGPAVAVVAMAAEQTKPDSQPVSDEREHEDEGIFNYLKEPSMKLRNRLIRMVQTDQGGMYIYLSSPVRPFVLHLISSKTF